jgi:acetyltransferase-like isoleucine patch superfamily enzyme
MRAEEPLGDDPKLDELARALRELRFSCDKKLRVDFGRSLPFADVLFNRWDRAKQLGFGERTSIYDSALIFGDVRVGADTWIGPTVLLDGSGGGLKIGSFCSISAGTYIYTHDTVLWALSGGALPRREGAVTIADRVYLGSQTLVLPGVTIGPRVVVAGNSLINRDVPEGWIVAGTPARQIGRVLGEGAETRLEYFERKSDAEPR